MDVLLNFKFSKPILSQSELVSMFGSMSESALKRFMKDWLDAGNDIREMGMFRKWLYENKINKIYKYDYEVKEQNDLTANLIDISNKRRKNVSNQN